MIDDFHKISPYSLCSADKRKLLFNELFNLTEMHRNCCPVYASYLDAIGYESKKVRFLEDIPFLPIRMFKEFDLKSIPDEEVFKVMMSSGTSGQKQSKIFLNKETAIIQQKVLLRLLGDFVGTKRMPMLIIDAPKTIKDRMYFTTRGATIIGLEFMATKKIFALDDDMNINIEVVKDFIRNYGGERFIIFGFTFMVWQHFFGAIEKLGLSFDLSNGYLLTAGGWKKLASKNLSNEDFKQKGLELCNISHYVDHYGMAEQTGCIYAECECGHLHASIYSDIIIRNYKDFSPCGYNEKGFIQVLSSLPHSYPGHSLLTEDEGMILGEDDCPCGRKGKYIKVLGRIKNAELRGCSDTYAAGIE